MDTSDFQLGVLNVKYSGLDQLSSLGWKGVTPTWTHLARTSPRAPAGHPPHPTPGTPSLESATPLPKIVMRSPNCIIELRAARVEFQTFSCSTANEQLQTFAGRVTTSRRLVGISLGAYTLARKLTKQKSIRVSPCYK